MWAFDGCESQTAVQEATKSVVSLASEKPFGFNNLFCMAGVAASAKTMLNRRQRGVVAAAQQKLKGKDIVVDVAKSAQRAPACDSVTPCIQPNSLPYRLKTRSILTPQQVNCVQGIFKADFPALAKYARSKARLTRDLAGNAFSTTVCMAVVISCLTHAPFARASHEMSPFREDSTESPAKKLKQL